jgi:plasmid stabilization system protein ParE
MVDRTRQVAWTRAALECLDEILATIAAEAPDAAARVLGVFDSTAASLSDLATLEGLYLRSRSQRFGRFSSIAIG